MAPRDSTNRPYRSAEQERARSIIDQVHELITELKTLVLDGNNTNDEHGQGTTSLIGSHVKITNGVHNGHRGRVIGRRGAQFWYICLEENEKVVFKKPNNFEVCTRRDQR